MARTNDTIMMISPHSSTERVVLRIDGKPCLAREGQTILECARENDIHIPTLCYHEKLKPLGSCRLCLVEIKGVATPTTACTTPVSPGMEVTTRSPALERLRRETLKLILLRHPLNCAPCELNGNCQLQDLAHEYDISHYDLHTYDVRPLDIGSSVWATPLIDYHPRRCILCGRCVQACTEITGNGVIGFEGRGAEARIAPLDPSQNGAECVSCGECLAICPVNALTESMGVSKGKAWETTKVETICGYCGCGCSLELNTVNGQVVGVTPNNSGVNRGELCVKGRFGYDFINHKDRLTQPLIRRDGYWEEVKWEEALDYVAGRLAQIRIAAGADAIAGLSSARCTNEENYLFQKLLRGVIGTNNVDHCARL